MIYHMLATCPEESKDVLVLELKAMGVLEIRILYKAVSFQGDEALFYRCHLSLRTASNLFWTLKFGPFAAKSDAYALAKRISWPKLFAPSKSFRVDAIITEKDRHEFSGNDLSKAVRTAIEEAFVKKGDKTPKVDIKDPKILVVIHQRAGFATISICTSGQSLHKRAYRTTRHPAPIKETVAATILMLAGYDGSQALLDPFCGSGTIAIEAAQIALEKAGNIHRKKGSFGFEHLLAFNSKLFEEIKNGLRAAKKSELPSPIFASDINASYISDAKENALRARVEKYIHFNQASFFDLEKPAPEGILIANLPYGERLKTTDTSNSQIDFFKKIGNILKNQFQGWQVYLLVLNEPSWKFIGLKPKCKFVVTNGSLDTRLLHFDIYSGSKKAKATSNH